MKPEDCPQLDTCLRIQVLGYTDRSNAEYAEAIRDVCSNCPGPGSKST